MPKILSIGTSSPPHVLTQETAIAFAKELFAEAFQDINRLLHIFNNGQIKKRHFVKELSWFERDRTWEERNNAYIESSVCFGAEAIKNCLNNPLFLKKPIAIGDIEAFFFVSSTGLATPTIDARIMNVLPFSLCTKRIPIWGLGCAGGAAGLTRAFEYCKAFPKAKVLVLAIELCSLTFQRNDLSKSNLIGTSLFADGVACVLVAGDEVDIASVSVRSVLPAYKDSRSVLMKEAEDVMGWEVRNNGLYVIFSKDIPAIIRNWLRAHVEDFLSDYHMTMAEVTHFIAHPGGKKVLDAYKDALGMGEEKTCISFEVLRNYGNMSSVTVLYVLYEYMKRIAKGGEKGLVVALGPGFSAEFVLVEWEEI
ncbi:MAG: type III polyketide synthase [Ectobacillus sp.]